ncbi:MAG: hypothetical protein OXC26_14760 [Albidovulum sp.]|nr:hypothetical protein [Albidovulum sp.]
MSTECPIRIIQIEMRWLIKTCQAEVPLAISRRKRKILQPITRFRKRAEQIAPRLRGVSTGSKKHGIPAIPRAFSGLLSFPAVEIRLPLSAVLAPTVSPLKPEVSFGTGPVFQCARLAIDAG